MWDEGLRTHYLAARSEPGLDPLEVLDIGNANPYRHVRIPLGYIAGDDFGNIVDNTGNGFHSIAAGETDLG